MKHIYVLHLLFLSTVTTGCEKAIVDDDNSGSSTSEVITDEMKRNALTVPQAIATEGGTKVTIKGYIVAAAENSIKKSDFHAPFEGSTALVLAARKSNGSSDQFDYSELIPICLTDAAKGLRDTYNLEENNQYWNQFVYISGTRKEYMSVPGIKKVQALFIDTSHVPTADEKADGGGAEEEQEVDDTPDNGEGDNTNGDIEYIGDIPVYNVAQAIQALTYQQCYVKGYIVATTSKSMGNIKFEDINHDYTAIVLADDPETTELEKLFPIGVDIATRDELAEYGDKLKNLYVRVLGDKETYLRQPGFKKAVTITPINKP